jgi:hypothetical protein
LRCHIYGAAHTRLEHLRAKVVYVLSEPEIGNFVGAIVDEYVGRFEISVNYFLLYQLAKATGDLLDYLKCFFILKPFAFDHLLQIAVLAELRNDVQTVLGAQHVLKLYDVGVVKTLQKVNFREDGILQILVVREGVQIYLFDGHLFLGVAFHALKDLAVNSLTKTMAGLVAVVADQLDDYLVHSKYNNALLARRGAHFGWNVSSMQSYHCLNSRVKL